VSLLDVVKAIGVALALMALNVAAAFGVVAFYSYVIEPGHDVAFYEAAARDIAPWSSVVAGALLVFAAMAWLAWRRAGRNGYMFAAAVTAVYAVVDLAVVVSEGVLAAFALITSLSIATKLAAALFGAWLARPR
jgi:hypothetical protein